MAFDTEQPTILVVEDNGLLRAEIAETLRSAGCRVLEAPSGEAAVALIRAAGAGIQVLVTDIQLGGTLTGWDVADTAVSADQGMAVIYVSGNTEDKDRRVPRSRFIAKPYRMAEIVAACLQTFGSRS
jgi:two-component system OmpR family response regulator